jgi:hypothetical protein
MQTRRAARTCDVPSSIRGRINLDSTSGGQLPHTTAGQIQPPGAYEGKYTLSKSSVIGRPGVPRSIHNFCRFLSYVTTCCKHHPRSFSGITGEPDFRQLPTVSAASNGRRRGTCVVVWSFFASRISVRASCFARRTPNCPFVGVSDSASQPEHWQTYTNLV